MRPRGVLSCPRVVDGLLRAGRSAAGTSAAGALAKGTPAGRTSAAVTSAVEISATGAGRGAGRLSRGDVMSATDNDTMPSGIPARARLRRARAIACGSMSAPDRNAFWPARLYRATALTASSRAACRKSANTKGSNPCRRSKPKPRASPGAHPSVCWAASISIVPDPQ